jgi:hypothetical protein
MVVVIESRKWNIDIIVEIMRSFCVLTRRRQQEYCVSVKLCPLCKNAMDHFSSPSVVIHREVFTYKVHRQVLAVCIKTIIDNGHNSAYSGNILLPNSCDIDVVAGLKRIMLFK